MIDRKVPTRLRTAIPSRWRAAVTPGLEYLAAPLSARSPRRRFVIVSGPRSGSELLRELLDSQRGVQCEGELLATARRWPLAYLNGRAALGGFNGSAWGCKILDSHLHLGLTASQPPGERLLAELVDAGWLVIHLQRHDLLAQALSILHAMQAQWHFRQPTEFERFEADPATVIALLHMLEGNANWLNGRVALVPHATVSYENELRDPAARRATMLRMTEFLHVPYSPGTTDLHAVAPADPAERLTNFAAVANVLAVTRFASYVAGEAKLRTDTTGQPADCGRPLECSPEVP